MAIILVKAADNNVPDSPGKWRAAQVVQVFEDGHEFGSSEVPGANFHHITVTDKTKAEVQEYMQDWAHNPTTTQVSAQGNNRLLNVASDMVSASGLNQFTEEQVDNFCALLNEKYPTANAAYDSHTQNAFRFTVKVPLAQREALILEINDFVRSQLFLRRRWYITSAGMSFLAGNGGVVSGTAAQVNPFLRDGLLD